MATRSPHGDFVWQRVAVVALALLAAVNLGATAQQSATITGALIDRLSRAPIEGARISILGTGLGTQSDSGGRFGVFSVPAGVRVIQVRAIGYSVSSWMVELGEGQVLRQTFELEGNTLTVDSITATAEPERASWRSESGFEARRRNGKGYFIAREDMQQRHAVTVADLMLSIPGLITACRGRTCQVMMPRNTRPCAPEYFLDGYPASFSTGPNFPVNQLRGVEIYTSRFDVPAEFQRANLSCGVIAIWTIEPGTRLEPR